MANGQIGKPSPTTADLAGAQDPDSLIQPLLVDADGNLLVSVTGSIVATNPSVGPNGAAIPADSTLIGGNDAGTLIPVKVGADGTLAVSAASLPLPTGAATSAKQDTGNASLASIDGKIVACNTGAVVLAAGSAIVGKVAIDQTTPGTTNAVQVTNFPATQPISGTVAATQSGVWNITNISGTVSLPTGAATEATLSALNAKVTACNTGAVTISTALPAGSNVIGHVIVDTAPTTAVTQSGAWTVQPGNTPNTTAWLVKELTSATATVTSVNGSASSVSLLASTAGRLGATFYNDSTAILYLKLGATASTTSYTVQLASGSYYELPTPHLYTGAIDGVWASATGAVRITELS